MPFTPPTLDSAEAETFQPPALSAEEFTPPPITAAEPTGDGIVADYQNRKRANAERSTQAFIPRAVDFITGPIQTPADRMNAHLHQMALAEQVSPGEDEAPAPLLTGKTGAVVKGGEQAVAGTLDSMVNTPLGIATLGIGGLPKVAQRAIAGAFALQMASQTPKLATELGTEMGKPEEQRDYTKISNLLTTAAINTGFTAAAGTHAAVGEAPPAETVQTPEAEVAPAANAPNVNPVAAKAAAMMPEQPGTLDAQMQWLQSGKRDAVLVTPGADAPPVPEGMDVHPTDAGTFIYSPERTSPEAIDQAVTDNKVGELLGYGIADKPAPENVMGVVTIRDPQGLEKQAVVTDEANLQNVLAKAKERADTGDTVQVETPEQVIARRQQPAAPVETDTQRFAREQRETMAAMRAQKAFSPPSLDQEEVANVAPRANERVKNPDIPLKPVEITPEDYKAARQGNNPFMEVETATGLAKDIKRATEFGSDALTERAGETEARPVNQLFTGDQFKVKGNPVHVADWVTDAETGEPAGVNVDGAYGRQFVPVDQTVHIDAGSLSDPVSTWFDQAIAATDPLKPGVLMEGVTGAPVWLTKTALNAALKIAKFAFTKTRDISRSVGEAVRFIRSQNLTGYNETEAMNWLESNLRGDPIFQDNGQAIGAATEERRPLENTSAAQQMAGSTITTAPFQQDLLSAVLGVGWRQRASGWLGAAAGETFPRSTRLLRVLGEQGARWIASRAAAIPLADAFSEDVTRGLGLDDVEFGAMLHEDNLRSIKQSQLVEAQKLDAAGDAAGAAKLRAQAQNVFSFVGQGGVFPDEGAYQEYLKRPAVQAAVQRHIESWERTVTPMYREAMRMDPTVPLPSRGLQTAARINLNFVRDGEAVGPNVFVGKTPSAAPKGVLSNVLQRRSPFGTLARGTAEAYRPSYTEAMRNTFSRQLEIANRNKFARMMVDAGHAVIDRPGRQDEIRIHGEGVTSFEIRRSTLQTNGQTIPQFENIYVRNSIAPEYRSALNLDPKFSFPIVTPISKLINGLALSGLTEVTAHVGNLSHALFWRPGVTEKFWSEIALASLGRSDAMLAVGKALRKFTAADQVRIRELTEISAMREPHPPKSNWNPAKWGGLVIEKMDIRTRLQLDRMYQNLREQGLVPDTETARREFVNQIGQYNRRAQGQSMHWLRDTGVAPFVTAGRAFNVLALRTALLSPGIETTGVGSRLAVAATMASKVGGTMMLIGTLNYLFTHKKGGGVFGRPGVALGAVDLGVDDKNKRPLTLNLANILGLQREARVTGVRGTAEALRYHLPLGTVLDSTYRDLFNSWSAPVIGPMGRTAFLGATGRQPAIGVPRTAPVVPPGQSQALQNAKTAAIESSPIIAGIHDSAQPGATGWEWLQKQGGRFTLQPGKSPQMVQGDQYPRIVARAQASEYINDVIMRARPMQPQDRMKFIVQSVKQLDLRDQPHALRTLEERGILPRGTAPR